MLKVVTMLIVVGLMQVYLTHLHRFQERHSQGSARTDVEMLLATSDSADSFAAAVQVHSEPTLASMF